MSETPYDAMLPRGQFQKAVDAAIREENDAFLERLADPEFALSEAANAERWTAILQAENCVGPYGVVMPMAVAEKMLAVLKGEDPAPLSPEMLARMLAGYIEKQQP